jgi:ubiquinone/menaquinone biosynthesis C-methylase UbiE
MKKQENQTFAKRFDTVADKYVDISNDYTSTRRIKEALKFLKGRTLEVGGASGNLVKFIKDKSKYVLSDISPKMCEVAKRKYDCNVVCCDAEKLPFKAKEFDSIVSLEVIYYLKNPINFIKESYRVLDNDGVLVISTFNDKMRFYNWLRHMMRLFNLGGTFFDDGIKRFMNEKKLKRMLLRQGFEIVKIKKIMIFPFGSLHRLNKILEKTFLKVFGTFIIIIAKKR